MVLLTAGYFAYRAVSTQTTQKTETSSAGAALLPAEDSLPYTNIDGEPISLRDYLGKVIIVNSWASWSPQSAQELSKIADAREVFAEDDVVVLAINRAESKNTAQAFLRSINVADSVVLILDSQDNYYKTTAGFSMPETVFYDAQGNIIFHKRGALETSEILHYTKVAIEASE